MFTKIRQVNYARLKKITTQGENLISNIEETVRTYRLKMLIVSKYLVAIGTKREKKIHLCCGSGFSDKTVFSFKMRALMSYNGRAEIYGNNNIVGD